MSSHTSMKTTRDTTQNALPRPLRDRSWNELEKTVVCASKGGVQLELSRSPDPQCAPREKLLRSVSAERLNGDKYVGGFR